MAAAQVEKPILTRSPSSSEEEYATPTEEHPLEINPTSSAYTMSTHESASNTMNDTFDEPPPPYEELASEILAMATGDSAQSAPQSHVRHASIEYSHESLPQVVQSPDPMEDLPTPVEPPARNPARNLVHRYSTLPELSPLQAESSPAFDVATLAPEPLRVRSASNASNVSTNPQAPVAYPSSNRNTFSSAKAREAGFEIEPPIPVRTESISSGPSITLLNSAEPLKHTRVAGKLMAYLVPFPKARLKGVRPENIPERFLVYTPPTPPLSKPAPGEKESQWHKTKRTWQEDVRRATMTNASAATWKGLKAKSTLLVGRGVSKTRPSNVEFLDRASDGALSATTEEIEEVDPADDAEKDAPTPGEEEVSPLDTPEGTSRIPRTVTSAPSLDMNPKSQDKKKEKAPKPPALEDLTLIYPPSLDLTPDKIRSEFMATLVRTRNQTRKAAMVSSALFPLAAGLDACLVITFGGLMDITGVYAYQSIRGASMSTKMSKGLTRGESQSSVTTKEGDEEHALGCTCGHHEQGFDFDTRSPLPSPSLSSTGKGKKKQKSGINLSMQKNGRLEILSRYLALLCLKKDFHLFPHIEESAGDPNEDAVLEAIGWEPTRRYGRDLEVEFKDKHVEILTWEQDEAYQRKEAREDVRRIMKKGAAEWVSACKGSQKDWAKGKMGEDVGEA